LSFLRGTDPQMATAITTGFMRIVLSWGKVAELP
jgi:hypothetical protein